MIQPKPGVVYPSQPKREHPAAVIAAGVLTLAFVVLVVLALVGWFLLQVIVVTSQAIARILWGWRKDHR